MKKKERQMKITDFAEKKTQLVKMRVTESEKSQIVKLAKEHDMTVSQFIRMLIQKKIERK